MYIFEIKEITKNTALEMVQKYHYSNTLPKLNKHFIGFYLDSKLVGVVTLGWGTRPLHTIKKLFPSLETKDYFEIGRMCMTEEMPRNSESQMLSQLVKWIKLNCPTVKVLFTWADGLVGKAGYVYQASNFLYAGFIWTDIYMKDGIKIHVRQTKQLFKSGDDDKRITARPTAKQMKEYGIEHYKGKQFKYLLFVCDKRTARELQRECLESLSRDYPKEKDLAWKAKDLSGKWVVCEKPPYKTDSSVENMIKKLEVESMTKVKEEKTITYECDGLINLALLKEKEPELYAELVRDYPAEPATYVFKNKTA